MPSWTKEQEQAIYTRGCNLLVAAAAGSGKTAVLVERIIQHICDEKNPVDVDSLLVVTFTNAAAAEMKERIGLAINEALKKNPLSKHLYRQSTLLNKASIMTLHSFCLEIVRENFYRIGIDPHFRIADETEGELLRLDVLEELLEKYYAQAQDGDDFIRLIDAYGGQNDVLIQELIIKLYQFSRSNPWPEYWLKQMIDNFTTTEWFQYLLPSVQIELEKARNYLVKALNLAEKPGGPSPYLANLSEEIALVDDLLGAAKIGWQEIYERTAELSFGKLPRVKKGEADPEIQERVKGYRDKAKEILKNLQADHFYRTPQELVQDLHGLKPYLKILVQLVGEFGEAYALEKSARNIVDFNDLEHFCLKILLADRAEPGNIIPSEVSKKLQEKYSEVLVDEYQDINDVQETILQLVARKDNLFMVGDVKQSIYRFRLANPELFLNKYASFNYDVAPSDKRIDLAKNFRCRPEVVDGVNYLFKQIMTPTVGEIMYDEDAQLVCGATYPDNPGGQTLAGPIEVHILEKKIEQELAEDWTPLEREAIIVGQRIKELVDSKYLVFDKNLNDYRTITFRDIVILLRSPKGMAETFLEQFRLLGIPVYAELGSGYFQATEVQIMLALLKIIDNPRQDIPLAAVLRSPILGLDGEELAQIRLNNLGNSFYEAVTKTANADDKENPLAVKLNNFLQQLATWRTIARQGDLASLIWTLYRETGFFDYVGALPGGSQRQANLRALHDRARQYEKTSFRGLFMFLRFLERLVENQNDMEAAKALSENENVVRIMSIHKSKGLEFPVVFVAGLGKEFNMLDTRQDIILHKDLGVGPVFIDPERRIKYPTIAKLAIVNKIKFETLAEEMRVLYVALTRAREKLILVGSVRDVRKKIEDWWEFQLAQAKTFLDWLGPTLLRHKDGNHLLRQMVDLEEQELIADNSCWQLQVYEEGVFVERDSQIAATKEVLEYIKDLQPIQVNPYLQDKISQRLNWRYPYEKLTKKEAKVTVTEIKHKFQIADEEAQQYQPYFGMGKRPVFLQRSKGLSAAEKGSAIHMIMQHIDLKQPLSKQYLDDLLSKLEKNEIITPEQREVIDKQVIIEFFTGQLGQRLLKAVDSVKRELPFSLTLPAYEIYVDLPECTEKVLLQGIIDCMWYEEDGWVLVDYKSDNVKPEEIKEFVQRYAGQINLYTRAVETIWKQPVKERYLYLFSLGQGIKL